MFKRRLRRPPKPRRPEIEALEDRLAPAVVFDEAISGDLSNSASAPTAVTLAAGTNSVKGVVGASDSQDWVKVTVPAGTKLNSLVLSSYDSTDMQGFLGVQSGPTFQGDTFDPASYLGYAHFGTGATNGSAPTDLVGTDLLPLMGDTSVAFGAQGFTPPLNNGVYTFLIQQFGTATTYQFDFTVTGSVQATSTTLVANPLATTGGSLVMLNATVAPSPGAAGTVTFRDNGTPIPGGTNVPLSGGVASMTTSSFGVGTHSVTAAYSGATGFAASTSSPQSVVISANVAPPQVTGITLNGGVAALAGPQHSRVVNIQVAFDQAVQLDANALTLSLHTNGVTFGNAPQAGGKGAIPTLVFANSPDNKTWTVTFTGANTEVGTVDGLASLIDGVYDFKVDAAKVHPLGSPSVNLASDAALTFHRLFGDASDAVASGGNFTAVVNTGDNLTFRGAFNSAATYKAYLDFNGDGIVNSGDNLQFRSRFNKTLGWTA